MGASQPWRWTALTSGAAAAAAGQPQVSCGPSAVTAGHQAAAAVQAASLHAGSAAATAGQLTGTPAAGNHHLATQPGLNYAAQVIIKQCVFFMESNSNF